MYFYIFVCLTHFVLHAFSCVTKRPLSSRRDTTTQWRTLWTSPTTAGSLTTSARSDYFINLIQYEDSVHKHFDLSWIFLLYLRWNTGRSTLTLWVPGSPSPTVLSSSSAELSTITSAAWVLFTYIPKSCTLCYVLCKLNFSPSLGQVQGGPGLAEGHRLLCVGHTWAGDGWEEQDAVQWCEGSVYS